MRFLNLLSVAAPAMLVGGLMFGSAVSLAGDGHAQPGSPVMVNGAGGPNLSNLSSVIQSQVRAKLKQARMEITAAGLPREVRDAVLQRLDRAAGIIDRRLARLDLSNLGTLDVQLEQLTAELDAAMEGLDEQLETLAERYGKDWKIKGLKGLGKLRFGNRGHDADDEDEEDAEDAEDDSDWNGPGMAVPPAPPAPPMPPIPGVPPVPSVPGVPSTPMTPPGRAASIDVFPGDDPRVTAALGTLSLRPEQRTQIVAARKAADSSVSSAYHRLGELSSQLESALRKNNVSEAEVARYVDQISAQEAAIRKARILLWVKSRNVLDADQRRRLEDATR